MYQYRSVDAIDDCLRWYGHKDYARYVPLEPSSEGRPIGALRLRFGGGALPRPAVLLLAGLHGNELMLPDILLDFVDGLVNRQGDWLITHGDDPKVIKRWPASVVQHIRDTLDIVVLPLSNPDGRELVLDGRATAVNTGRKNRRMTHVFPWIGVDLNRNFALPAYDRRVTLGSPNRRPMRPTTPPWSDTYNGLAAFSEVESRNVQQLLTMFRFECLIDLHANAQKVLYPWGHAPTQTNDDTTHNYMDPADLAKFASIGGAAAKAMNQVHDAFLAAIDPSSYEAGSVFTEIEKAPGSALDYAYDWSRERTRRIYSFCLELGRQEASVDGIDPADVEGTFRPQGFTGLLTILEACANRIFETPGRVTGSEIRRRYVGVYDDAVSNDALKARRREP